MSASPLLLLFVCRWGWMVYIRSQWTDYQIGRLLAKCGRMWSRGKKVVLEIGGFSLYIANTFYVCLCNLFQLHQVQKWRSANFGHSGLAHWVCHYLHCSIARSW
jgi:hypothetical protein